MVIKVKQPSVLFADRNFFYFNVFIIGGPRTCFGYFPTAIRNNEVNLYFTPTLSTTMVPSVDSVTMPLIIGMPSLNSSKLAA